MKNWFELAFGFNRLVDRKTYFLTGIILMIVKYAGQYFYVRYTQDASLTPLEFFLPFKSSFYYSSLSRTLLVVGWSLPFLWIGVSMTMRRAVDAGLTPWLGLLFFLPGINYLVMLGLSLAPSSSNTDRWKAQATSITEDKFKSAAWGIGITIVYSLAVLVLIIGGLGSYGNALFVGIPLVLGVTSSYLFNRAAPKGAVPTLAVVSLAGALLCGAIFLFALEGAICIAMAVPIAFPLAWLGGLIGWNVARFWGGPAHHSLIVLLALPGFGLVEAKYNEPMPPREILSSMVIKASPEKVWEYVVAFPELPPPQEWYFKAGISYPKGARIDGTGVGATRYCQFSTGDFVEPITHWEPPRRLAFDVTFTPAPMKELSPYEKVYAPHLDGYFQAKHGEFRLIPQADGTTLLEGRTWYTLNLHPLEYWQVYADNIVKGIHHRVLQHLKNVAENESAD